MEHSPTLPGVSRKANHAIAHRSPHRSPRCSSGSASAPSRLSPPMPQGTMVRYDSRVLPLFRTPCTTFGGIISICPKKHQPPSLARIGRAGQSGGNALPGRREERPRSTPEALCTRTLARPRIWFPSRPARWTGQYVIQCDKDSVDDAKMVKIHLLGLGMLSLVGHCWSSKRVLLPRERFLFPGKRFAFRLLAVFF